MLSRSISKKLDARSKNIFLHKKRMRIALLGPGQVLGDMDLIHTQGLRDTTAVCYSQEVSLLKIEKDV